ncbi:MAG: arylamine N-acetyltransferase [Actinomycetota bacterium]
MTEGLDLDAYLARIGYEGELHPTPETLAGLHRAHALTIPFENLDILLGRPILLDLPSLQAKLVDGRRGGYCFEQNSLFAGVLEHLGFAVTRLAARVRMGDARQNPRTHMALAVDLGETRWLADVGFGAEGLLDPLPFGVDAPVRQSSWTYRLDGEGDLFVVRSLHGDGWVDLYAFDLQPQLPVDSEMANHYTSTSPRSSFVKHVTVQRPGPDERLVLWERSFVVQRGEGEERIDVRGSEQLLQILRDRFGLVFPEGTRFPLGERS